MTTNLLTRTEPYSFNSEEPSGLTEVDGAPGEAGAPWADVWQYQLPAGYVYLFDRSSTFSAYLAYLDEVVDAFVLDDNGSLTDDTVDARDAGTGDVAFVAATPVATEDFIYIGYRFPFQSVTFDFSQAGAGSSIVWDWEYYNGSAWANLSGLSSNSQSVWEDGTGDQTVSWTVPGDMSKTLVGNHYLYWVRVGITTMTTDFTTVPLANTVSAHGSTPEIATSNEVRLVWTDPNEEDQFRLMGSVRYAMVREFQQDSKLHRMDIADVIRVPENYFIKVQVKAKATVDASNSYFNVVGQRVRLSMYG